MFFEVRSDATGRGGKAVQSIPLGPPSQLLQKLAGINRVYRQCDFNGLGKNLRTFSKFALVRQGHLAGELTGPPGSKSVAKWQTHFFLGRNFTCFALLQRKLSLPTV